MGFVRGVGLTVGCIVCGCGGAPVQDPPEGRLVVAQLRSAVQVDAATDGVVAIEKASGAVTVLARDELNPLGIAVDSTHVYYTRNDDGAGAVIRIPKEGGVPEVVATRQLRPIRVHLTSTDVYWTNRYGERTDPPAKDPELRSIPKP